MNCLDQNLVWSGSFEIEQKKAYECFKNSWTYTGGIAPVPIRISINHQKNVTNQSTIRPDNERSPWNRIEIHTTQKPQGNPLDSIVQNWSKISQSSSISTTGKTLSKGKEEYWIAYKTAMSLIHKYEWLRLEAYWDHKWYSIGYGTRSHKWEKISKKEADRRVTIIVTQLLHKIQKDFPSLHPEWQGALVSFAFNCSAWYRDVKKRWLMYHGQWCRSASGRTLQWLVNRRLEESNLLFNKNIWTTKIKKN
jgi:GH24 family phage-related lysozyme (muramidase)